MVARKSRIANSKRGETLVEAIVSFAIALIVLTALTFMIKLALNMNRTAAETSDATESAATQIEKAEHKGAVTDGKVTINAFGKGITVDIKTEKDDPLVYFYPGN